MEQLFKCVCLDSREYLIPFNPFMDNKSHEYDDAIFQALTLLQENGHWHKNKIVWAGNEEIVGEGEKNFYQIATDSYVLLSPQFEGEMSEYISDRYVNTQIFASKSNEIRFLVNFCLKEYVDLGKFLNKHDDIPHPLAFLTSTPVYGKALNNQEHLGRWRLCELGAFKELPKDLELTEFDF